MASHMSPSDGSSLSRIGRLTTKVKETLSFAAEHSLCRHPDFQPLSLPYPFQDTAPPSPLNIGVVQKTSSHHSESPPSPEEHPYPTYLAKIPPYDDHVVNPHHLPMPVVSQRGGRRKLCCLITPAQRCQQIVTLSKDVSTSNYLLTRIRLTIHLKNLIDLGQQP